MRGNRKRVIDVVAAVWLAAFLLGACGGGSPAGPTPAPGASTGEGGNTGGTGVSASTTITITSAGVTPNEITVPLGSRVTFVNNDIRPHEMNSNPHPDHTDCDEINQVSFILPGQSRDTRAFLSARTCGYHDHGQETNTALQGRITVR